MARTLSGNIPAICLLPLLFGLCLGCQDSNKLTHPVSGRVRFSDGTPLTWGMIEFQSADLSATARGKIQPDGSFRLGTFAEYDGAILGRHRAIIMQVVMVDKLKPAEHKHGAVAQKRFAKYETSGLEFEVIPGQNSFEVVVEKDGR